MNPLSRLALALVGALLAAIGLISAAPAAFAHAQVEQTTPQAGATLESAPEQVSVTFNEPIQVDPATVQLLNSDGQAVPVTVSQPAPPQLIVTPNEELTTGQWTAAWTVLSTDGHLVHGTLPFRVGESTSTAAVNTASDTTSESLADTLLAVLEPLAWLAGAAAGMLLAGAHGRTPAVLAAAGALAAAARIALLTHQAGSWQYAIAAGETRASVTTLAAAVIALTSVATFKRGHPRAGKALSVSATALFAAQAMLSGHHLTIPDTAAKAAAVAAHMVHLAAAAAWAGAVIALAVDRSAAQAQRTRRQATIAVIALIPAALLLTTLTLTAAYPSLSDAWSSPWTQLLAAKAGLVSLALAGGLVNHQALAPERIQTTLEKPRKLRRFLIIETAILAVVAATTAGLAQAPLHAHHVHTTAPAGTQTAPQAADSTTRASGTVTGDDTSSGHLQWTGSGGTGTWTMHLAEIEPGTTGTLTATHEPTGVQTAPVELDTRTAGELSGDGQLPLPGAWTVAVTIKSGPFTTIEYTGTITTSSREEPT